MIRAGLGVARVRYVLAFALTFDFRLQASRRSRVFARYELERIPPATATRKCIAAGSHDNRRITHWIRTGAVATIPAIGSGDSIQKEDEMAMHASMGRLATLTLLLALFPAACSGGSGGSGSTRLDERIESFSFVRANVLSQREIEIVNPFASEAVADLLTAPTGGFSLPVRAFPMVLLPSGTRSLFVTFEPAGNTVASGEMLVRFRVEGKQADLRIRFDATVETPSIELLTPDIAAGDVPVGNSTTRPIRIRNSSSVTPVRYSLRGGLPDGLTISPASGTIEPGVTRTISLSWKPRELVQHELTLFFGHDAVGADLEVEVTAEATTWGPEIVTDFGAVPLVSGETGWLEVYVPPEAISLNLEAIAPNTIIGLLGFEGPGGHVYENEQFTGVYFWDLGFDVFTAPLPSSDRDELKLIPGGGIYRFRFFLFAGSANNVRVRTIVHTRPGGVATDGRLDVNVFLAPGLGIDPADAGDDVRLQEILSVTGNILGQIGLDLGSVSYYALTDSSYDEIDDDLEFGEMLEESRIASEERLNLFFVETAFGFGVVGVAARISGPRRNGTIVSGVMVDYDFGSTDESGYVTAHEIGHFLGLLHTTEQNGLHDLIDDTLECPPTGTDATCPTEGNDNLMHWLVLSVDPVITDGQALVVLGHPLVGPVPTSHQLTAYSPPPSFAAPNSPLLVVALPEGWCGTKGCCPSKE